MTVQPHFTQSLSLTARDGEYVLHWVATDFRAMMSVVDAIVAQERELAHPNVASAIDAGPGAGVDSGTPRGAQCGPNVEFGPVLSGWGGGPRGEDGANSPPLPSAVGDGCKNYRNS